MLTIVIHFDCIHHASVQVISPVWSSALLIMKPTLTICVHLCLALTITAHATNNSVP